MAIEPGLVIEQTHIVQDSDTAKFSGGTTLPAVLSTPRVIGWMEGAAHDAVQNLLQEGQTTVGTLVNIKHLAATPPCMQVRTRAELLEVDGRRLRYRIEAWDAVEKIAEGDHERFIIDCNRFTARLDQKIAGMK